MAAWVLNLDADLELALGRRYTPKKSVLDAMAPFVTRAAADLLSADDVLVTDGVRVPSGTVGRAFCPTPRAIESLLRAGASPEPHPPVDVLREVNGRGFCSALGPTLPGAVFVRSVEEAFDVLSRRPPVGRAWRLKRPFGLAGRGQRAILGPADHDFVRASIGADGAQLEPDVPIVRELAVHGFIARDATVRFGRLVVQTCNERGRWLGTALAPDGEGHPMLGEAARVAQALTARGYFGPFGIDGFEYRDAEGALRLQPRSEINARYSMGFAVGFGRP